MGERLDEALARVTDLRDRGIGAVESMDGFESVYGETAMDVRDAPAPSPRRVNSDTAP